MEHLRGLPLSLGASFQRGPLFLEISTRCTPAPFSKPKPQQSLHAPSHALVHHTAYTSSTLFMRLVQTAKKHPALNNVQTQVLCTHPALEAV